VIVLTSLEVGCESRPALAQLNSNIHLFGS